MKYLLFFAIATALSALFTPLVRLIALRTGVVNEPRKDRWHARTTPVLGGIAIVLSFTIVSLFVFGLAKETLPVLLGGIFIFFLGLYDDLRGLTPQIKFIGQIAVTGVLISMGTVIEIVPWPVVAYPLTFFWIVGLTNAFNLIDNMDGLSAGIAAISALALFMFSLLCQSSSVAVLSMVLAGSCIGFLFYNFNPARIFMGDCGSMFLGFTLAVLSISGTWKHASSLFVTLLVPVVILGIPIFDTAFVTLMRRLRGQPISRGGRDHLSHRLVALGFSERKTVIILYSISAAVALGALFFNGINPAFFSAVALIFFFALFYFCVFLGYSEAKSRSKKRQGSGLNWKVKAFLVNIRRLSEIFVDLVLVVVSYFAAYLIRFEGGVPEQQQACFIQTLPIVIVVKMSVFYFFGLYRTVWRHVGVRDFINIVKSILTGSLIIVAAILMYSRFQYFSRTVFVVDAMMSLLLISGAHFFLRILREYLESQPAGGGAKVLLIGAGDAGEMALREIRNNPLMKFNVVGFVDDDPFKQKRKIHGVQVLGRIDDIEMVSSMTGAAEAIIAMPSVSKERFEKIMSVCLHSSILCRRFGE